MTLGVPFSWTVIGRRRVAKAEWGSKRLCLSCGAKFFDFDRTPIICPKCETTFVVVDSSKTRRAAPKARWNQAAARKAPSVGKSEEARDEGIDDDDDDA